MGDLSLIPGLGRSLWRRERLPDPVFWPGEFHGLYRGSQSQTQLRDFHFHQDKHWFQPRSQDDLKHVLLSVHPLSAPTRAEGAWTAALPEAGRQPRWGTHQSRLFLVRWLTRLPLHSKGLLNSKFILHREEERIRHKLNQVSLFLTLNIKSEG